MKYVSYHWHNSDRRMLKQALKRDTGVTFNVSLLTSINVAQAVATRVYIAVEIMKSAHDQYINTNVKVDQMY